MNHYDHNPDSEDSPRDELDHLLDEGLAQYSQVEPLTGLEDRILARLEHAAEEPAPRFSWAAVIAWFTLPRLAGVTTALLLAGGIWLGAKLVTEPGEDIDYVGENTTIDVKGGKSVETAAAPLPARIPQEAFRASLPKIAEMFTASRVFKLPEPQPRHEPAATQAGVPVQAQVFPAPAPLSEQEQLALAYARMSQRMELASATVPEPGIRELEVELLEVAPIQVKELEKPGLEVSKETNSK
jgi:hypothetical protein